MRDDGPPAGYVQFIAGTARVACAEHLADSLRTALADTTLYDYAARQPEIHDARPTVHGNDDVAGLQIAVNDALFMGMVQRLGDIDTLADGLL